MYYPSNIFGATRGLPSELHFFIVTAEIVSVDIEGQEGWQGCSEFVLWEELSFLLGTGGIWVKVISDTSLWNTHFAHFYLWELHLIFRWSYSSKSESLFVILHDAVWLKGKKWRLFGELSSSCCFPLGCSVSTRPWAFLQEIIAVLSMELLALAPEKENLFFMKPFHVREKRRCF